MSLRGLMDELATKIASDIKGLSIPASHVIVPPVGFSVNGGGILGATAGTAVYQRLTLTPFLVGPVAWTADAALYNVTTAVSGGTNIAFLAGIYADDGTGQPKFQGGPLASSSQSSASLTTGAKTVLLSAPITLKPGLYWVATLLTGTAAPTTSPAFQCITNNAYQLAVPSTVGSNTSIRAYTWSGQTALPTTAMALANASTSVSGSNDAPLVNLRRSA
ncbi:hypothetical protein AS850_02610 [Frondihabitans sp. 762G35]|uniref:hypothetical protein n=1 Tax=Frondihabitans sp. 762G35 TaxID=1446794 RepID=UPI000D21850D|nr:hypothetical protein [Frondihabitans sp. 762G35]ARC55964.1 hypothetical protein AS850_02610 [Frondihabitans sp. 762G35]